MPMYEVRCADGHEGEQFAHAPDRLRLCPCGATVTRQYRSVAHVRQDSIPGGLMIENWGPVPVRVDSWSDYRRECKARGVVNRVEHAAVPGSDRSPQTTRWY